ncbi:MAG: extracellular solute-binding protein [Candidatus Binatia bacterium]
MKKQSFFLAFVIGAVTTLTLGGMAQAQKQPWEKVLDRLYPAAKAEGQVTLYMSSEFPLGSKEGEAKFKKRFPGIEFSFIKLSRSKAPARIILETRAGRNTVDGYWDYPETAKAMIDRGLISKLNPAELTDQPEKWNFMFDHNLPVVGQFINTFYYNTKLVSKSELPKRYEDLLDPKWKGKLAMDARGPRGFTHLPLIWGEEKFWRYIKALKEQNPIWTRRCTTTMDKVLTGEALIGCTTSSLEKRHKAKGQPVEYLLLNPVSVKPTILLPIKGSPHPNAIKLVIAWLLSPEGVEAVGKTGYGLLQPGTGFYETLKALGAEFFLGGKLTIDQMIAMGKTRKKIGKTWGIIK